MATMGRFREPPADYEMAETICAQLNLDLFLESPGQHARKFYLTLV
jgi:hypothetical protein